VIAGVADTHAALWYLLKNPRLSATARSFIDDAANAGHDIVLSPISLAEIVYLVEKGRLSASAYDELREALAESMPPACEPSGKNWSGRPPPRASLRPKYQPAALPTPVHALHGRPPAFGL
jgi:predicted nucleic acid-binding protein